MSIKNKIGVPVTGEDFFGRRNELVRAQRYLDEGQSLLLSAPRRVGKTSLAKKRMVDIEDVEAAINELSESEYFRTWDERQEEYRELEDMARIILENVAVVETGLSKDQLLQVAMKKKESSEEPEVRKQLTKVMEMLEHDGYIMRRSDKRRFRSPLLRKWWKHKFLD